MDSTSWWALLLDLDGTLIRTDALHFSLWRTILATYDIPLTREEYNARIAGRSDAAIWEEWGVGTPAERAEWTTWKEQAFLSRIQETVPVAGAKERIEEWVRAGQWVGVVTNSNRATALALLDRIGITHHLDVLITSESGTPPKPSPAPYQEALYELGIPPERCIIVEDSEVGLASARNVSPFLLLRRTDTSPVSPASPASPVSPASPPPLLDFWDDRLTPPPFLSLLSLSPSLLSSLPPSLFSSSFLP